jgi:hypothetical protein
MTIGERFAALLDTRGIKQAALAAQYRERALTRGREFAQDTIESHISRLKKAEPVAGRFFFADLTDARDLLDLLAVPEDERGAYVRDANSLLSPEERPLRAIVDLSDSVQGRALVEMCDELADKIVLAIPERVALVVTESQRQYLLPRCTPEGRVQVEVVASPEQGWARTQKLAADGAIVVSGRHFDSLSRWIAFEQCGRQFMLEPNDGIARCAAGKPIDDADAKASLRKLDVLVSDVAASQPPQELTNSPRALRSLIAKLVLGRPITVQVGDYRARKEVTVDEKTRAAWGKGLNVPAVATEEQWGGALMARAKGVGVAVSASGDANDLASHRARVVRGGSTPRAILVGGELHLINASAGLRDEMRGLHGVQFHDEAQRESGFKRIEALVAATPWEAWLDDPYMDAAIARIDPDGKDRDELEFARASLLLHNKLRATAAPCSKEWRKTLSEILTAEPPPVGVRVPTTLRVDKAVVTLLPESEIARRASQRGAELHGVPAIVPPRIVRESPLGALTRTEVSFAHIDWHRREEWCNQRRFLLPREPVMVDFDWVFTLFDSSPAKTGYSQNNDTWWIKNEERHMLGLEWTRTPLPTHAKFWREADETLAALWIALRRAVQHADSTTLHDGTGMLEMGGGVVALIKVSHVRAASGERVEADFMREPRRVQVYEDGVRKVVWVDEQANARPTASIMREIGTRVAHTHGYETRIMADVPTQVFLAKGMVRVTITFKATPWETFGERSMKPELGAAAAGALHAEDDARRAADDDDE